MEPENHKAAKTADDAQAVGSITRQRLEECALAFMLLTRIPLPDIQLKTAASLATAIWVFPLIGALVGAIGAATFLLASVCDLGAWLSALLALAAMILATGGFHEDGLADFWDGLGGGRTPSAKLAIMRDSHLGTYGALALFFGLSLAAAALAELALATTATSVATTLVMAGCLSRVAILIPLHLLKPARTDGLAASMKRPAFVTTTTATLITTALGIAVLEPKVLLASIALGTVATLAIVALASRYIGGHTGDVLGAVVVTSFVAVLIASTATV